MDIETDTVEQVIETPHRGADNANRLELVAALLELHGVEYDETDLSGSDRIPRGALLDLIFEADNGDAGEQR